MNRHAFRLASLAFLATFAAAGAGLGLGAPAPSAPKVADLGWISGSWETESGPAHVEEHWTCPGPGAMYGTGRTVAKGKTAFFEFLRIEERPDGVFYVAQPKGGPGTDFKLVRHEPGTAVFENLKHDFPKRIIYTKGPDGALTRGWRATRTARRRRRSSATGG